MARTTSPQGGVLPPGFVRFCTGAFAAVATSFSTASLADSGPVRTPAVSSGQEASAQHTYAGEVVLSAGPAYLRTVEGETPVTRGTQLKPGDTVVTGEGGFVHVRMADGGLVAIRPLSLFQIEVFNYSQQAANDRVRYRLEEGVARSITGKVGETNKEAFRFNTPVAAVGVRGTDFVVATTSTASRVAVNSGAVVVAPLSESCSASGFGACNSNSVFLGKAESTPGEYVEVVRGEATPRMVRDPDNTPDRISPPHDSEPSSDSSSSADEAKVALNTNELTERRASLLPEAALTPAGVPQDLATLPPDVHWGRWTRSDNIDDSTLTRVAHLVRQNLPVQIANTHYGAGVVAMATQLPRSGRVDFAAAGGSGVLASSTGTTELAVAGGRLSVNFDSRSFETDAHFASADRIYSTQAAGGIDNGGFLRSDPALSNSTVAGVLGENLNSAVTTVERNFDDGLLSGVVAWGVRQ